ncbi:MAG: hypothetical protein RL133_576 [Pseudomonadota bacterium]
MFRQIWFSLAVLLGASVSTGSVLASVRDIDRRAECARGLSAHLIAPDRLQAGSAAVRLHAPDQLEWSGLKVTAPGVKIALVVGAPGRLAKDSNGHLVGVDHRVDLAQDAQRPSLLRFARAIAPGEWRAWVTEQMAAVVLGEQGQVLQSSAIQMGTLLDWVFADAARASALGFAPSEGQWRIWAPTAKAVALCRQSVGNWSLTAANSSPESGVWSVPHRLTPEPTLAIAQIEVFVPGVGLVLNQVTDPYAHALTGNARHFALISLDDPRTMPRDWREQIQKSQRVLANRDMVVYELHVRDFSWIDNTVPVDERGRYGAFRHPHSNGMRHLERLSKAGVTDVHLLPVFDIATVDELACDPMATDRSKDCFNWGYDPLHFNAPEGVYSSDPDNPFARIREFREMVLALRRIGLRVGMDVVYNHTARSGQDLKSVLDRVVPGYYHRLSATGKIEQSTCCENTATERVMMDKLMRDSLVLWAKHYGMESFRFDLMGHQPRQAMIQSQIALDQALGRPINFLGEGWNFGEVADGRLFPQASQLSLYGTGIATFSDRARDAIRGGSAGDRGADLATRRGLIQGQITPEAMDLVRLGLVGNLREIELRTQTGTVRAGEAIPYAGQPAGYAASADEVVHYVENHDNHTLFDLNVMRAPADWNADRLVRAQLLALATTAFSQGIAYLHAGVDILRSKSMDRNSYDSGDAVNRIDWSLRENGFGVALPPKEDHGQEWEFMQARLEDARRVKPSASQIQMTHRGLLDLLRIRRSSPLFSLGSQANIQSRTEWLEPIQGEGLIGLRLHAHASDGKQVKSLIIAFNFAETEGSLRVPLAKSERLRLHPVHRSPQAADPRPRLAKWSAANQSITVPALTAMVWEVER